MKESIASYYDDWLGLEVTAKTERYKNPKMSLGYTLYKLRTIASLPKKKVDKKKKNSKDREKKNSSRH